MAGRLRCPPTTARRRTPSCGDLCRTCGVGEEPPRLLDRRIAGCYLHRRFIHIACASPVRASDCEPVPRGCSYPLALPLAFRFNPLSPLAQPSASVNVRSCCARASHPLTRRTAPRTRCRCTRLWRPRRWTARRFGRAATPAGVRFAPAAVRVSRRDAARREGAMGHRCVLALLLACRAVHAGYPPLPPHKPPHPPHPFNPPIPFATAIRYSAARRASQALALLTRASLVLALAAGRAGRRSATRRWASRGPRRSPSTG